MSLVNRGYNRIDPHNGEMFVFNANPWRKLTAFRVGNGSRCLVIIGGQSDGFYGLNYTEQLIERLAPNGWSVVQALFSSWYAGFGTATLEKDLEDLDMLINTLLKKGMTDLVLLGHHTGAQDVVFYMQSGQYRSKVSAIILQGGLRDPIQYQDNDPDRQRAFREQAQRMINEGRGNQLMPESMHPKPISAFRFLALGGMQGVEDFFNPNLNEEEMAQVIGHIKVPLLVLFCCDDSYKPTHAEKNDLFDKIQTCMAADVTTKWISGACDEHFNFLRGFEDELSGYVNTFLGEEDKKRLEKEEEIRREQEAESKRGRSVVYQKQGMKRSISQSSISSNISQTSSQT